MDDSLHNVSLIKIALFTVVAFVLSVLAVVFITPFFPESAEIFLSFLAEVGIVLAVALFIIKYLRKNGVSLQSIVGETSVSRKLLLFFSSLTLGKLLLSFSFAGLVLRVVISRPEFQSLIYSLLDDSVPTEFNIWMVIGYVILAPLTEEFIFRGLILNKWAETSSNKRALIVSSLLFGILHFGSLIIPQFIGGLLYGIVYIKTKKLVYPILMHAFNNLLAVSVILIPVEEPVVFISLSELITELIPVLNVLSILFIITLPIFLSVVYKYSRNLNEERTPFAFNTKKLREL